MDIDLESEGHRTTEVNERKVEINNSNRWRKMNTGEQPGSLEKLGRSRRAFSFRLGVLGDVKPRQLGPIDAQCLRQKYLQDGRMMPAL